MRRLKILFAVLLFLLLLPVWRLLDYTIILLPGNLVFVLSLMGLSMIFVTLPLFLLGLRPLHVGLIAGLLLSGVFLAVPLSNKGTLHPEQSHCGGLTFTGFFYPIHEFFSEAYADDLVARNQLCWLRKLIAKTPSRFKDYEELKLFVDLTQKKLLMPKDKFSISLPLIAFLYGNLAASMEGSTITQMEGGKLFLSSLQLWKQHYTVTLTAKDYGWWDALHGAQMRLEYGLIERNWEWLLDNVEFKTN